MLGAALVAAAFAVDILVGDPPRRTHPVVLMGGAVSRLERRLRAVCRGGPRGERLAGAILTATVTIGAYCASWALLWAARRLSPATGVALEVWLLSTTIAARDLARAARAVYAPLSEGDLALARGRLGMIVGRDTDELGVGEIVRAAVETVAENTSDGVVAPLLYALVGGAPLAMAYKAVNTLDSMVGYKDERYIDFGRAAAKLDDSANYVPARIGCVCLVAAAAALGEDWREARRTLLRDGRKHPSPNSGLGEAAVAGALGVRLGGFNTYGGKTSFRDYLGDETQPLQPDHIMRSVRLMYCASVIMVVAGVAVAASLAVAALHCAAALHCMEAI